MENCPPPCARPRSVAPARGGAAPSGADDLWPGPLGETGGFPWGNSWDFVDFVDLTRHGQSFWQSNPKKTNGKKWSSFAGCFGDVCFFLKKKPRMKLRIQGWG